MRLDLGRALEDVEDAGVAQDAAHGIFHRVAVAAVDLQRVVGVAPGDARRQQQSFSAAGTTDSCPIRKNSSA